MKNVVVLTGAGISAESGIQTFRGADGLWEGHDIHEVASPEGWQKNKELVLDFYNKRRRQLKDVEPNAAHFALKELEECYNVDVITQNVDDLHERAGSSNVLHLHGELRKIRSTFDVNHIKHWEDDIKLGDLCPKGHQYRPHIVWFGEAVPMIDPAIEIVKKADIIIIVGTSMQVYPAASLVQFATIEAQIFYVDPKPHINHELSFRQLEIKEAKATEAIPLLVKNLCSK